MKARNAAVAVAVAGAVAGIVWWRRRSPRPAEPLAQLGLPGGAVRVLDRNDPSTTELVALAARVRDSLTGGA